MNPYYQHEGITIYHGDCREILPTLESVDLVLTDPPYGIDYNPVRSQGSAASGSRNKLAKVTGDNAPFNPEPFLLLAPKIVLWGANNYAHKLPQSNGWLIWDKRQGGTLFPGYIGSDAEMAWTNLFGRTQMFSHAWCGHYRDSERDLFIHPTQKPLTLMKWCIKLAGEIGTILDPFMGTGTTLRAAKDLGRKAIGIEIEERYCEIAVKRMSQEVLQFSHAAP